MSTKKPDGSPTSPDPQNPPRPDQQETHTFDSSTAHFSRLGDRARQPVDFVGERFGEYELFEKLGAGGMGIVFRARQRNANRFVALKLIRPERIAELSEEKRKEWVDRFRSESQAAARLSHENVVTVYDVGDVDGVPYYSMHYIEGMSLAELIRHGPLDNNRAAQLLLQVSHAIAHAHAEGILHRDLKPRNILVTLDNSRPDNRNSSGSDGRQSSKKTSLSERAYVMDFGLAKYLEAGDEGVTRTGEIIGTPEYMSPEQAQDTSRCTISSDIYSLGATLYDVLTGRPPFRAAHVLDTLQQVINREAVSPRELNPTIDRDLETITLKCLAKEPERRYLSTNDVVDDLTRYINNEPIHARPIGHTERFLRWTRRNPRIAWLSAAVFLLSIVIAIGSSASAVIVNQARMSEAIEKGRAEKNAELATKQSALALDTLSTVVFETQRLFETVPASHRYRRKLLQKAISGLNLISERLSNHDLVNRNMIVAHASLGEVFLRFQSNDEFGTTESALREFERAREIADEITQENPKDPTRVHDLWSVTQRLGECLEQLGRVQQARAVYDEGMLVAVNQLSLEPHNNKLQLNVAISHSNRGRLQLRQGELDGAMSDCQSCYDILAGLRTRAPDNDDIVRHFSVITERLSDVYRRIGNFARATELLQEKLQLAQYLTETSSVEFEDDRDLSIAYDKLGLILRAQGRSKEALESFIESTRLRKQVIEEDPDSRLARRSYVVGVIHLADMRRDLGEPETALSIYLDALPIAKALSDEDGSNVAHLRDLGALYSRIGAIQRLLYQVRAALESNEKDLAVSQRLSELAPNDKGLQRDVAVSFNQRGDIHMDLRESAKALDSYGKSLSIRHKLAGTSTDDMIAQGDLFIMYYKHGKAYELAEEYDRAIEWFEKGTQLYERIRSKLDARYEPMVNDLKVSMKNCFKRRGQE